MKILHCSKIIGIAGSENYLLTILPALQEKGVHVEFLALVPYSKRGSEKKFITILENANVTTHIIYYKSFLLKAIRDINKLINFNDFNIIHTHLIHADFFLSLTKSLFNSTINIVSTKHGYDEMYNNKFGFNPQYRKKNIYWRIAKWSEKRITKSFAISKGLQNLYIGLKICKSQELELIYYGFNFPTTIEPETPLRESENQLVIVGRLTNFKGHRYAIRASKLLKERRINFKLLIIGSGHIEKNLKKEVKDLDLEEVVIFKGYQPNGIDYMMSSDIVLVPSRAEGFGVIVLEAMASKKPIIAFNVPALNEHLIHNHSGILVPPYNINLFADEIESLLKDELKRNQLADNAYTKLSTIYSLNRMLNETINFYHSVS
ncbi:MAG: glycosyltransferase family 4 protein [Flavobacteriales bacterium]|nr:glycosyltransferase family 4 protein [Flavobacteriales bacterium]MCB9364768.1 glycosyltransferase family 4 protein [Flavobacteriales bacterium]